MEAGGYVTLTRQAGLLREMASVAQNIANLSTTGYRREGVTFAEHVAALGRGEASLSMAHAHARHVDESQGALKPTGGRFDFAIEGPGFFQLEGAEAPELTRAGAFSPDAEGFLAAPDGARLLDAGGAPVFVPPGAREIALASDGTLTADGQPLAEIGLVLPGDPADLTRRAGARFAAEGALIPVENGRIVQGFVEGSNVDPVAEIARMIEVQHAYQLGQTFLDREDERLRGVVQTLGK